MKKIRKFGLLVAAFTLSLTSVWAIGDNEFPEALNMFFFNSDAVQSTRLDDLQRITFSGDDLLLQTQDANETSFPLNNVRKIAFGELIPNGIAPVATTDLDIRVYLTPQGEVMVETSRTVLSLTLFDITGKKWQTGVKTGMNISNLSSGVYLVQINTAQGCVTKKIIKQ